MHQIKKKKGNEIRNENDAVQSNEENATKYTCKINYCY